MSRRFLPLLLGPALLGILLAILMDLDAFPSAIFVHRLNHELKNPLTAIHAALGNVAEESASVANARRQVERLGGLVSDLRKLADLETRELERAPVDLAEVVTEAVELARADRCERNIRTSVQQVPWRLGSIQGDRDLLLLALYNLIDNALKFSPPDALVEIRAAEDGTRALLEVADTGSGIRAADLPHITEELYRGRRAQGIEGSGLGLALVQRIVALHGGEMAIRSREGQGTARAARGATGW